MRSTLHTIYMDLGVEDMMMFIGEGAPETQTFWWSGSSSSVGRIGRLSVFNILQNAVYIVRQLLYRRHGMTQPHSVGAIIVEQYIRTGGRCVGRYGGKLELTQEHINRGLSMRESSSTWM